MLLSYPRKCGRNGNKVSAEHLSNWEALKPIDMVTIEKYFNRAGGEFVYDEAVFADFCGMGKVMWRNRKQTGPVTFVNWEGDIVISTKKEGVNHGLFFWVSMDKIIVQFAREGKMLVWLEFDKWGNDIRERGFLNEEVKKEFADLEPATFLKE